MRKIWENPPFSALALSCSNDSKPLFLCPVTGYPCEGDLSHLCEDYGCARKGGLSPRSEENLWTSPALILVDAANAQELS